MSTATEVLATTSISAFIKHHYRHFNAAVVVDAAEGFVKHLAKGGKMFLTLAGAMSTAELGISVAEMIRQNKVHGDLLHGRESRRGSLQPRRARSLPARSGLPAADAGARGRASRTIT